MTVYYADPHYLTIAAASIVLLVLFAFYAARRRRIFTERFIDRQLLSEMAPLASSRRRTIKAVLIIAAIACALVALARPQWGFEWQEIKSTGLDMLIAVDVSKSMLATDVRPNRLERTKFAIKDLVQKLSGDRVGLIAFAGTAFLQCPLTIDYNGLLLTLEDLAPTTIPRGGTSISSAIYEAIKSFSASGGAGQDKKYRVLVVITDGEDLEGDAMKAAQEAASAGIKIYCIGVGTEQGELIPLYSDEETKSYLQDRSGNVVKSRLNEDLLKKIAIATGGSYIHATSGEFGLVLLYDKSISRLEKRELDSKLKKHYTERFQIFLAIGIILFVIEALISERKWGAI